MHRRIRQFLRLKAQRIRSFYAWSRIIFQNQLPVPDSLLAISAEHRIPDPLLCNIVSRRDNSSHLICNISAVSIHCMDAFHQIQRSCPIIVNRLILELQPHRSIGLFPWRLYLLPADPQGNGKHHCQQYSCCRAYNSESFIHLPAHFSSPHRLRNARTCRIRSHSRNRSRNRTGIHIPGSSSSRR